MSIREASKNQRRRRITGAARKLIRLYGLDGFSMRALATEAGVSIATPYNLFGSKRTIMQAVLDSDLRAYANRLRSGQSDEIGIFFDAVTHASEACGAEPEYFRCILGHLYISSFKGEDSDANRGRHRFWKQLINDAIAADVLQPFADPDDLAIFLRNILFTAIGGWMKAEISIEEANARAQYGIGLSLAAFATPASHVLLQSKIRDAQDMLYALRLVKPESQPREFTATNQVA